MKTMALSALKKVLKEAKETQKNKCIELRAAEQHKHEVEDEYVDSTKYVCSIIEAIHKIKKNNN